MNTARRIAVLTGLMAALVIGTTIPASAQFSASETIGTSVSTGSVAAPTSVSAERLGCEHYIFLSARVSWAPSTSERVTGYKVTAYLGNQPVATANVAATARQADLTALVLGGATYSVTTITDNGWTAESARTATVRC